MSNVLDILQGTTFGYKDRMTLDSIYHSSIAKMFLLRLYSHFNFGYYVANSPYLDASGNIHNSSTGTDKI